MSKYTNSAFGGLRFRDVADSAKMNAIQNDLFGDILGLIDTAGKMEKRMEKAELQSQILSMAVSARQTAMDAVLSDMIDKYKESVTESGMNVMNIHADSFYSLASDPNSASISKETMDATMPYSSVESKVRISNIMSGKRFVPPSLLVTVSPAADGLVIIDTDLYEAFAGNGTWIRKEVRPASAVEATCDLVIDLPKDLMSTKTLNTLLLDPFPHGTMMLAGAWYANDSGAWIEIPGIENHTTSQLKAYESDITQEARIAVCGLSNMRLVFNDVVGDRIKLSFTQRNYVTDGDNRIFYFGLGGIDVITCAYATNDAVLYAKTSFYGSGVKEIQSVVPVFNNLANNEGNHAVMEYFALDSFDSPTKIMTSFPFDITNGRMMVKVTLKNPGTAPCLSKLQIRYKDKES